MCLIITTFAAVIASLVWYIRTPDNTYRLGTLALMYWGASLMWICDGVASVIGGESFFDLSANDALLGVLIALLGLVAWLVLLLVRDPKCSLRSLLSK